jgi:hypothetical protein
LFAAASIGSYLLLSIFLPLGWEQEAKLRQFRCLKREAKNHRSFVCSKIKIGNALHRMKMPELPSFFLSFGFYKRLRKTIACSVYCRANHNALSIKYYMCRVQGDADILISP